MNTKKPIKPGLVEVSDNWVMSYGLYKGKKIGNIPASYLLWMFSKGYLVGAAKNYVVQNEEFLKLQELNEQKGIK